MLWIDMSLFHYSIIFQGLICDKADHSCTLKDTDEGPLWKPKENSFDFGWKHSSTDNVNCVCACSRHPKQKSADSINYKQVRKMMEREGAYKKEVQDNRTGGNTRYMQRRKKLRMQEEWKQTIEGWVVLAHLGGTVWREKGLRVPSICICSCRCSCRNVGVGESWCHRPIAGVHKQLLLALKLKLESIMQKTLNSLRVLRLRRSVGGELKSAEWAWTAGRKPRQNAVRMVKVVARQLLGLHILCELLFTNSAHHRTWRFHLHRGDAVVYVGLGSRQ